MLGTLEIEELIRGKILYPSEKKEQINSNVPINKLLLDESSDRWLGLLNDYLKYQNNKRENYINKNDEVLRLFKSFYPNLINFALEQFDTNLQTIGKQYNISSACDVANIKRDFENSLEENLAYMSIRVLVQDLNEEREKQNLLGSTSDKRYEYYISNRLTSSDKKTELFKKYPVLARILFETVNNFISSITEAITHFLKDRQEILSIFHLPLHDIITSLSLQLGDSHNNGKSVIIFNLLSGGKIVYKPRPLSVDSHFQQFLNWINSKKPSLSLKRLTILNKNEYGWQEYIDYKSCESTEQLSRFYKRQGYYIAILYLLNATDFHYENIIAHGEDPVLIDLEGLIQNTEKNLLKEDSAYNIAFNKLINSVLTTGMLPVTYNQGDVLGFDYSGLGGRENQLVGQETFTLENIGTDELKVVKTLSFSESSKNRPIEDGNDKIVLEYLPEIINGFKEIYILVLKHKEELLSSKGPLYYFKNDRTRVILRSTQIYSTFLDSSYHPDYLGEGYSRERLINFLWLARNTNPEFEDIIMFECRDILKGDIPYFYCYTDSTELNHKMGIVKSNYFRVSNFECLLQKGNSVCKEDMDRQANFIEDSILSRYSEGKHSEENNGKTLNDVNIHLTDDFSDNLFLIANQIGEDMKREAIFGYDNDITWIGINTDMDDELAFSPLGSDLYDGLLGIGLYYANLYNICKDDDYKQIAERAVKAAMKSIELQEGKLSLSAFYGYGAYAYVLGNFSIIFNQKSYLVQAKNLLKKATIVVDEDQSLDFLGGSVGLIIVCIHLYKKTGEPYLLDIANRCGMVLLRKREKQLNGYGWVSGQFSKPIAGLSHGASGYTWALMALYEFTNNDNYRDLFEGSLNYENSLFDKQSGNWLDLRREEGKSYGSSMWCHGAAGIGMSRIMMSEYSDNHMVKNDIKVAINQTLKNGFGNTHCLCHGDLGNLDLFLLSDQYQRDDEMRKVVLNIGRKVSSEVGKGELKFGTPSGMKNLGLMIGQAGIGYGLLRVAFPELVPSLLTLQYNT